MSDKLIKKLFEHSEHPVTGKMVLTNPDGPAAADEIERLRGALRFYAKEENWLDGKTERTPFGAIIATPDSVAEDFGDRAREALGKINE